MTIRDIRTMNMTEGQKIESDNVMKRIGDLAYRNLGTLSKISMFDQGKALIVGDGFRVEPSSGMTVNIPSGSIFQRFVDVIPCLQIAAQTVTLDAATGVARTDIIEAQIKLVTDKNDVSQVATVASGSAIAITNETIKRDIKYYLSARNQTDTTTPTAAIAGILTGTVAIAGTIDLSERYLLNLADGEDGGFQEIDCRGGTPEATTRVEIINAINAAVGRTMASTGSGDVIVLTGNGTGQQSYFSIQPSYTDTDKDCLEVVFGLSIGGIYRYNFEGTNEWFKLAEIDVGTVTTVITSGLIRNVNEKSTWTGESDEIMLDDSLFPGYNFVEQNITAAIDLFDYFNDLIIYSDPSADITLTVTNNLPQGKKLKIINTSNVYVITLNINSTNYTVNPQSNITCISNGAAMFVVGQNKLSSGDLSNLEIANDTDTDNDISVAPGECRDSTNTADIVLPSAMVKRLDAAWAAGTGNGGIDAGSKAADTWYYLYVILKDSDLSVDVIFSANAASPTMPSGYTYFRRIRGAVLTDGSSNILQFFQKDDRFWFKDKIQEYSSTAAIQTRALITVSVPPDTIGFFEYQPFKSGEAYWTCGNPLETDTTPSSSYYDIATGSSASRSSIEREILTDGNSQVYIKGSAAAPNTVAFTTIGFIDPARY